MFFAQLEVVRKQVDVFSLVRDRREDLQAVLAWQEVESGPIGRKKKVVHKSCAFGADAPSVSELSWTTIAGAPNVEYLPELPTVQYDVHALNHYTPGQGTVEKALNCNLGSFAGVNKRDQRRPRHLQRATPPCRTERRRDRDAKRQGGDHEAGDREPPRRQCGCRRDGGNRRQHGRAR